jgi:ribosomal protein L37AE/L43A
MIDTVLRYPRRQWPVCPNCGSRETLKTEKSDMTVFQCEACQYQWPRVQPPPERLVS